MIKSFAIVHSRILLALLAAFALGGCQPQKVILVPGENDLVVLNGCVISACNYLAVVETQHSLEPNFWAKILLVRYKDRPAGHAYCVWETSGTIYGYDRNGGSFPIPTYTRDPKANCRGAGDRALQGAEREPNRGAGGVYRAEKVRALQVLAGAIPPGGAPAGQKKARPFLTAREGLRNET